MEHSLKAIDGWEPIEIEEPPKGFREIPRNHHAIGKFPLHNEGRSSAGFKNTQRAGALALSFSRGL